MTIDIAQLKKISQSSMKTMVNYEENAGRRNRSIDDRFWKPTADDAGNGSAIIRFLPALKADQIPFVQTFSYFIKARTGNKWYVNKSRRTLNEPDPMQEYYYERLNRCGDNEDAKAKVRSQFRASNYYIANILVLNDPAHPENNGKVFLYRFGKKILNKITDKLKVEFPGDEPINIFDWMEGCNFKLRMTRVSDFPNYDSSEFQTPSALSDDQIQYCAEHLYDLGEFTDPSTFKSYDELKKEVEAFAEVDEQGSVSPTTSVASAPSGWTPSRNAPTTNIASAPKVESAPWEDDGFDSLLDDIKD